MNPSPPTFMQGELMPPETGRGYWKMKGEAKCTS